MLEFLQMAPPPKWRILYLQCDGCLCCVLLHQQHKHWQSSGPVKSVVLCGLGPENQHKATVNPCMMSCPIILTLLLNRPAVLLKSSEKKKSVS